MSQLENDAKPIVESILDGKLTDLNASAQSTLAVWAVKTTMVLEAFDSNRPWFYSEDERQRMRAARALPQCTSVWIAKCIDHRRIYIAAMDLIPNDNGFPAFAMTMAFGSLALQVLTIRTPEPIRAYGEVPYNVREGPWDQTLVQVWPPSQSAQMWPPSNELTGALELGELTNRLSTATR